MLLFLLRDRARLMIELAKYFLEKLSLVADSVLSATIGSGVVLLSRILLLWRGHRPLLLYEQLATFHTLA